MTYEIEVIHQYRVLVANNSLVFTTSRYDSWCGNAGGVASTPMFVLSEKGEYVLGVKTFVDNFSFPTSVITKGSTSSVPRRYQTTRTALERLNK